MFWGFAYCIKQDHSFLTHNLPGILLFTMSRHTPVDHTQWCTYSVSTRPHHVCFPGSTWVEERRDHLQSPPSFVSLRLAVSSSQVAALLYHISLSQCFQYQHMSLLLGLPLNVLLLVWKINYLRKLKYRFYYIVYRKFILIKFKKEIFKMSESKLESFFHKMF